MGRKGSGVEVRESSIRVHFTWNGEPFKETLMLNGKPLAPTLANQQRANRIADEIKMKIKLGLFRLEDYFPHSKRAAATESKTFGGLADRWVDSKGGLAPATQAQYRTAVRFWKEMFGADTAIERLQHDTLASKIGGFPWLSAKQHNNYMIVLRGVIGMHYRGRLAVENPLIGVGNLTQVRKLPDPLTASERDAILSDMRRHYDIRVWAYFQWMFFTGMRPEEAIALRWSDIDWSARTARVQRVRTFLGSEREGSKTHVVRDVDLTTPALEALAAMKPFTFMKRIERDDGESSADIFERPEWHPAKGSGGGRPSPAAPWSNEREQRDRYWNPTLRRCGIRARRAYITRATFCTVALMRGVKPAYIAQQAGHSVKMLLDKYARWIPGGDNGSERAAMEAAHLPDSSLDLPQANRAG